MIEGLFNIASNASHDKFRYDSRVGNTPAYTTMLSALYGLSKQAAQHTLDVCRDPGRWFWIVMDNVQNYHRRRSPRLGVQNEMNIGMAGTAYLAPESAEDPSVFDYEDKEQRRAQCQRDQLTTGQLLKHVDFSHERKVFVAQWLWILGTWVPSLSYLRAHGNSMLRTEAQIQRVPDKPTEVFPLPTTSGRETELPELLASILDLLKSAGQTARSYLKRMLAIGGDGLTFELLLKLQQHRQFHSSPFDSLRILNPVLQWWHTLWTNDARVLDRHLVSYSSLDPSTIGHSASKIGRKVAKDQGKYNYHQASEILYFVTDAHALDCWRYI